MQLILEELKRLLAEKVDANIAIEAIDPDAPLLSDGLNLDSVAIIDLIGISESAFRIQFREDDLCMESFASLRALAKVIELRRAESHPPGEGDPRELDYIQEINALCEDLLRSHGPLLALKNIRTKRDLIQAIKLDLDKLTHALLEVKENRAPAVLQKFFVDAPVDRSAILGRLANERICHVGFEIHEPLDLVLHGIDRWIAHGNSTEGSNMRVKNFLRFPSSKAFETRVGAPTEIMRIALEVEGRGLLLELFDIHRPADDAIAAGPAAPRHRNFAPLARGEEADADHDQRLTDLFSQDAIWHYALHMRNADDVVATHRDLQALAAAHPAYRLAYAEPVPNKHDGSFHTKILRPATATADRLELEFVTQI